MQDRVTTKRGFARQPSDALEVYFREVASHRLLTAEDEVRLAREIEARDLEAWTEILAHPPVVDHALSVLEAAMENSMAGFKKLRAAAAVARERRTVGARRELRRLAAGVSAKIRALDLDRTYRDVVRNDLHRAARGERRGRLGFSPGSKSFADYLVRVDSAERDSDRARWEFVNANLRLVVTVARKYRLGGLPLEDLIQEGNLGLMKAVNRFDHRRGLRFSTYATWWIRHNVGRAIAEKSRTIRLPVHLVDSRQRIARARRTLSSQLGRPPTVEEISVATELSAEKVETIERRLPERRLSLDQPLGDGDSERTRFDVFQVPHDDARTPFDELSDKTTRELVRGLLRELKPIEADILRQRFGLGNDRERTLQFVANQYGLSRERIRQIQQEAFSKLRRILGSRRATEH